MSEKNSKMQRRLKEVTKEDPKATAEEMAKSIRKMYDDRDKKAINGKESLVKQLKITSKKYKTANGVMAAMTTLRDVLGNTNMDIDEMIKLSQQFAYGMSDLANTMALDADELDPECMDQLCDSFFSLTFAQQNVGFKELTMELLKLSLCQNVGPDAQDVADFCKTADEEIDKARENLKTFCADNDLDFDAICGE